MYSIANRIIQQVQAKNAGYQSHLMEIQPSNREGRGSIWQDLPRTAISSETTLPLIRLSCKIVSCAEIGAYLAENIKYEIKLKKPVILKKPSLAIEKLKQVLAEGKNIEDKIKANHALSRFSDG